MTWHAAVCLVMSAGLSVELKLAGDVGIASLPGTGLGVITVPLAQRLIITLSAAGLPGRRA